jgi:hypothetical protein
VFREHHRFDANGRNPLDLRSHPDETEHSIVRRNASLYRGRKDDLLLFKTVWGLRRQADYTVIPVERKKLEARRREVEGFLVDVVR